MVSVGVLGSTGRMGQTILDALKSHPRCTLSMSGTRENLDPLFKASDVVVDFTTPDALPTHVAFGLKYGKPLVVGTTGLSSPHSLVISAASSQIPLVVSSNMSVGMTLLTHLVEKAAHFLDESYDIEIAELHHRHKKDAPSGTSLLLGERAAKGRGKRLDELRDDTDRQGERAKGAIGFSVQRGGMVIGDHSIRFIGDEEMLDFSHRGLSRAVYAKGALRAAEWVTRQQPGLYSMADVLGI
ncbi:MAG: 4-hydroxy-tetrahydrodipicolinate reductase [Alphaproteobacteria bacterium]|nr:4-hydroxy-tetrahydrodipicolinate reductase [Alphaproteobacteria bacterium]